MEFTIHDICVSTARKQARSICYRRLGPRGKDAILQMLDRDLDEAEDGHWTTFTEIKELLVGPSRKQMQKINRATV